MKALKSVGYLIGAAALAVVVVALTGLCVAFLAVLGLAALAVVLAVPAVGGLAVAVLVVGLPPETLVKTARRVQRTKAETPD